ncbi:MAG: extracellular solute-binding protein [Chloroflexi bacterium]|nr:extracellular solute-binding protein [Chloroflexota bacterium]
MIQRTLSRRGFLATLAGVSGTMLLAACSSAPAEQSSAGGANQAPAAGSGGSVTLRVQERANNVVQGGPQYQLYQDHLSQWKAAHPNVDVQVESLPTGSEYNTKVLSLLMGGGLGDVVYSAVGSGSFQSFANAGVYAPLDDLVKQDNLDLGQYLPNMVSALRLDESGVGSGPLYGLPLLVHARDTVLFYNKSYLSQAGVQAPDGGQMSYDDLVALGKELTTKDADGRTQVYGIRESNDYEYLEWQCLARGFGTNLISEDGKTAQFSTAQAKPFWQFLYDLHNTWGVAIPPSAGTVNDAFLSGNAAMVISGGYLQYAFQQKKDLDFGATPVPKGPSGVRGSMTMGDTYGISSQAKQKELAWDFIKWMTNKDAGVVMCSIGLCGARPDVINDPQVQAMPMQPMYNRLVADGLPFLGPANLRQVELNDVSRQVMGPILTGTHPDDQFLANANTQIQQVLDKPRA